MTQTLFLTHPSFRLHEMGAGHPECPERLDAISDQLLASGLAACLHEDQEVLPATTEQLARVHTSEYIDWLRSKSPSQGYVSLDPDTFMNAHTHVAALHAAGAAVRAVDEVMNERARTVFCSVRPPGHHAMPGQAMGFCFFNNVAVAAAHALAQYGLERIAIIDFDVHHGNGTEAMFAGDERVLMCSFFQYPLFPNTGVENPAKNMVNIPVPPYTKGAAVREVVTSKWLPRLHAHRPALILVSAGFDAHREDDMGQMGLVEADYAWITEQVLLIAEQYAQARVISVLEGGYNLSALGRSVVAHIKALAKL